MKNEDRVISKDILKELNTIEYLEDVMMTPSVSPDAWEKWEAIKKELMRNRGIDIEWDKIELMSTSQEATWMIRGKSSDGREYEATGIYAGDSLEKIEDIELIQ